MTISRPVGGAPERVLLATDLSGRCDRAQDRAASLAAAWGAELIAVHALEREVPDMAGRPSRLPSWRRPPDPTHAVEARLRRDIDAPGTRVRAVVERGDAAGLVERVARETGAGLIVTGIARDEMLGRFGLGTTVDRLLRRTRVPLLVVKERVRGPYGRILVASDFSDASRCALEAAASFFPDRDLTMFHAYDVPSVRVMGEPGSYREEYARAAARDCARFLEEAGVAEARRSRIGLLVEEGRPADLIHQYVRDRGTDLVVLGSHGRGALFEFFFGSTLQAILSSLPCDALIVREARAAVESEA